MKEIRRMKKNTLNEEDSSWEKFYDNIAPSGRQFKAGAGVN